MHKTDDLLIVPTHQQGKPNETLKSDVVNNINSKLINH